MSSRLSRWFRSHVPSREALEANRFIAPVAHRVLAPELWRFTRRSVPRGVALGLLVGIFLMIPGLQIAGAAMLAMPVRANVPLAVAMTFLSNPATTPFIVGLSFYVGNFFLGYDADLARFTALIEHHASVYEWTQSLLTDAAPILVFGLFVVAVLSAAIGYVAASTFWRMRVSRKWASRQSVKGAVDAPVLQDAAAPGTSA